MNAAERAKAAIDVAAAFDPTDAEAHVATPHGWLAKAAECDAWSLAALGTTDAAAWRAAASACVEAWQASRERAEVREEAEAAVECAATAIRTCGYLVIADETVRNWRDGRTMWLLRGLVDCVADMGTGAEVFAAIEAVARWRRAEMEET